MQDDLAKKESNLQKIKLSQTENQQECAEPLTLILPENFCWAKTTMSFDIQRVGGEETKPI